MWVAQTMVGEEKITTICGICDAGCGVHVHMCGGRIERLTPIKGHPLGIVCPRGARACEIVYSPDRLLYPQKRVGPRGGGEFARIGWDEAYDIWLSGMAEIAARHGPEAVCMYTGRGNFEFGVQESFPPVDTSESSASSVLFPFGSPNTTGVGALCFVAYGMIAPQACFGQHYRHLADDFENADLVLIWGANPATDSPPAKIRKIKKAQKQGARVVCIDHRYSETARGLKTEWLGIRPGTDGALALAIAHVMIAEGLYHEEFVERWCHGFDAYRKYVQTFTPGYAAALTGVPAEDIADLARAIGMARGCAISMYTGLEYSNSGVQSIRAVLCLQALGGFIDAPGGKVFKMPDRPMHNRTTTEPPASGALPVGAARYPVYHELRNEAHAGELPAAILDGDPYPVRGLIISGASITTSWPDPGLWCRAFESLDLLVAVNRFPTTDSLYADLVLPATTGFEIESYHVEDGYAQWRQRVVEPLGEARPDYLIFAELARRLGYGHLWPASEETNIRRGIEGLGITLEDLRANPEGIQLQMPRMRHHKYETGELRADGKPGFATPTGKFEFTSEWLRGHGYDALPVYVEPTEGPIAAPGTAAKYPLVFNSGARTQSAFRTQHHNIPGLNALQPLPQVWLHPRDAAARGIEDGMAVDVTTPRGAVRFHAFLTEDIMPGCVEANMGGGNPVGPAAWQSCNVNVLTDPENCDPISGFPVYKALLCDVRPAAAGSQ
ncbi:MAG: molybdopterin-dependent oxidoreductase [Rhodobacteraceae bacterium]|nr:molybdopterin-dependent oxidoreductase [Paracoccaceae bacterium]